MQVLRARAGLCITKLCDNPRMNRLSLTLFALLLAPAATVHAEDVPNLLPVEQAFRVEATASDRQTVKFDFKIANDYYLYRKQIKTKAKAPRDG